jgi:hypothetical protein
MKEVDNFNEQSRKLNELFDDNGLTGRFDGAHYPIVLEVSMKPKKYEQGKLLDDGSNDETPCDPNAKVVWIFKECELSMKVEGGTFTISKELRTKIESTLLKMVGYLQQYFYRAVIEKKLLKPGAFPKMPDYAAEIKEHGSPLEDFEEG